MKRLGVLGTMVWDTIFLRDVGRSEPAQEWGGICYALSAFEAAAAEDWSLFPIIKVGADLTEEAHDYMRTLTRVDSLDGVLTVPEPNNRVELFYRDSVRRCEKLHGGVPAWSWEELAPLARDCDAIYVNFIAGWELDLESAKLLRSEFAGPLYCDLHSIFLGIGPDGVRVPQPLAGWRDWFSCFDLVQLNEHELSTLAGAVGDPWALAADVVGQDTRALFVTLGERGAAWVAAAGFEKLAAARSDGVVTPSGPAISGFAPSPDPVEGGDPTGCGDVWGTTCFATLLGGATVREAVERANLFASRNAAQVGATGLGPRLAGEPGIITERK